MADKYIYILLTNTGSIPSRLIKFYTQAPYTHVSIGFDERLSELYSFGRKRLNNPIFGGFIKESANNGMYRKFGNTRCCLYRIKVDYESYCRIKMAVAKFESNPDLYKYNFLGLLGLAINIPIERKYRYFCSQFVATVLKEGGVHLFDKHPALIKPEDFISLSSLGPVYMGKLTNYSPSISLLS